MADSSSFFASLGSPSLDPFANDQRQHRQRG